LKKCLRVTPMALMNCHRPPIASITTIDTLRAY
jgi:hypothetical protein